jgi:F0F1-type ATP synthase beta subunit
VVVGGGEVGDDDIPEQAFYMVGGIEDAVAAAAKMAAA